MPRNPARRPTRSAWQIRHPQSRAQKPHAVAPVIATVFARSSQSSDEQGGALAPQLTVARLAARRPVPSNGDRFARLRCCKYGTDARFYGEEREKHCDVAKFQNWIVAKTQKHICAACEVAIEACRRRHSGPQRQVAEAGIERCRAMARENALVPARIVATFNPSALRVRGIC